MNDRTPETPTLLDVRAVAVMLGCSPRHIYRMSDAGKMPAPVHIGTLVRWSKKSILEWCDSGCPAVRSAKAAR